MKSKEQIIKTLRKLEKDWPNDLWIFVNGMNVYLMEKSPDGSKQMAPNGSFDDKAIVEAFSIPNDGGDW